MKTALIFPGQGAQFVGMGKDFYDNFSAARNLFDEAGDSIKRMCLTFSASVHDWRRTA